MGTFSERIDDEKINAYLSEIAEVSRRHGFCIDAEDPHGGLEVVKFSEYALGALKYAFDKTVRLG